MEKRSVAPWWGCVPIFLRSLRVSHAKQAAALNRSGTNLISTDLEPVRASIFLFCLVVTTPQHTCPYPARTKVLSFTLKRSVQKKKGVAWVVSPKPLGLKSTTARRNERASDRSELSSKVAHAGWNGGGCDREKAQAMFYSWAFTFHAFFAC